MGYRIMASERGTGQDKIEGKRVKKGIGSKTRKAKEALGAKKSSYLLYNESNGMIPNALDSVKVLQRGEHSGLHSRSRIHDMN